MLLNPKSHIVILARIYNSKSLGLNRAVL